MIFFDKIGTVIDEHFDNFGGRVVDGGDKQRLITRGAVRLHVGTVFHQQAQGIEVGRVGNDIQKHGLPLSRHILRSAVCAIQASISSVVKSMPLRTFVKRSTPETGAAVLEVSGAEPGLGVEELLAAESVLGFGVEEGELLAAEAVLGFEVEEEELFETGAVSGLELAEAAFWEAGAGEAEPFISAEGAEYSSKSKPMSNAKSSSMARAGAAPAAKPASIPSTRQEQGNKR